MLNAEPFMRKENSERFLAAAELLYFREPALSQSHVTHHLSENGCSVEWRARGSDVADAAPLLHPQADAESAPSGSLEEHGERSLSANSSNSAVEITEVTQVADVMPVVKQSELSSDQINAKDVHEADSLEDEQQQQQIQPEVSVIKISNDESIDQSQEDNVSQEVDFDKDDEELYGSDVMDLENTSEGRTKLYSLQQINTFLDNTKGLRKPSIESYFPDLKLFLVSCTVAMRKATFDELDRPKRYRLKKLLSNVRSILHVPGKRVEHAEIRFSGPAADVIGSVSSHSQFSIEESAGDRRVKHAAGLVQPALT
ncbi:unnamed protein product [Leuciscus chuanchicus]